MWETPLFIE